MTQDVRQINTVMKILNARLCVLLIVVLKMRYVMFKVLSAGLLKVLQTALK